MSIGSRMNDMEKRLVDKIEIGKLKQELATAKIEIEMKNFVIDDLLQKIEVLEEKLGIEPEQLPAFYAAYCGTGKEQK